MWLRSSSLGYSSDSGCASCLEQCGLLTPIDCEGYAPSRVDVLDETLIPPLIKVAPGDADHET